MITPKKHEIMVQTISEALNVCLIDNEFGIANPNIAKYMVDSFDSFLTLQETKGIPKSEEVRININPQSSANEEKCNSLIVFIYEVESLDKLPSNLVNIIKNVVATAHKSYNKSGVLMESGELKIFVSDSIKNTEFNKDNIPKIIAICECYFELVLTHPEWTFAKYVEQKTADFNIFNKHRYSESFLSQVIVRRDIVKRRVLKQYPEYLKNPICQLVVVEFIKDAYLYHKTLSMNLQEIFSISKSRMGFNETYNGKFTLDLKTLQQCEIDYIDWTNYQAEYINTGKI